MAIFKIIAISELEQELQNIEGLKIVKKEYKTDNPSYNMIDRCCRIGDFIYCQCVW